MVEDAPAVDRLYSALEENGFAPWMDRRKLMPGQNWEAFQQVFQAVSRPELVHHFEPKSAPGTSVLGGLKNWLRP